MLEDEQASGAKGVNSQFSFELIGQSSCMQELKAMIQAVSSRSCTVLISGETGTGKEMVARQIHQVSPRANGPFIPVDCTTLRDTLFESQLFGHVKGSFTGAISDSLGFFRSADGGTLFLDEIGELEPHIQAKLLRCIQEQTVVPLGGTKPIPVDVRIIAATHRNIKEMVQKGQFREDLYYRLNVIRLEVPPLRERREDILPLAKHFLNQQSILYNEPMKYLDTEAEKILLRHSWPGNVRELANAMEHAYVLSNEQTIFPFALPQEIINSRRGDNAGELATFPTLADMEKRLIVQALNYTNGRKLAAANLLGIERRRFNRLMRNHKISN